MFYMCRVLLEVEMGADNEVKYQDPELWKLGYGNVLALYVVSMQY